MEYVLEVIKFGLMLAFGLIGLMVLASVVAAVFDHPRPLAAADAVVAAQRPGRGPNPAAGRRKAPRPVSQTETVDAPIILAEEPDEELEIAEMIRSIVAAEADCLISTLESAAPGTEVRVAGEIVRVQEAWGYGGLLCEVADGTGSAPLWFPADQDALPHEGQMIVVSGWASRGRRTGVKVQSWYDPLVGG